jgi:hypothetical protein
MFTTDQATQLRDLLPTARTLMILLGPQPSVDQVAAATALALSFQSVGKEVILASPQPNTVLIPLLGLDQVKHELGHQNLEISFAYEPTAVDKVSYHIDDNQQRFHLVIKPQKGASPLDAQTIEFAYTGASADLLFLVGVHDLESLAQLYFGYEELYTTTSTVTLHTFEPALGNIKITTEGQSSFSELVASLLKAVEIPVSPDAATNLLAGIEGETHGFTSYATTAETFQQVAELLRSGARRLKLPKAGSVTTERKSTSSSFASALQLKPKTDRTKGKSPSKIDEKTPPPKSIDQPRTFYP